jgi:DNA-binding transcriptional LysR family regulator
MDRIDCLRAFVRVMESGSFSTAANELGVGQPAISKRIALLEEEFTTQLFLRSTRKLKPTAEAHRVYDLARQLLHHFEQARSVTDAAPQPSGTLRLSVPSSFGRRYIMPVVADYLRDHPQVRVDIRFSDRRIDFIEQGIELALHLGPLAREFAGRAAHLYGAALSCRNAGISAASAAAR